eukprot:4586623-Prymnesium_polylepis.2
MHDLFPDACPYLLSIYLQMCPMRLVGLSDCVQWGWWDCRPSRPGGAEEETEMHTVRDVALETSL